MAELQPPVQVNGEENQVIKIIDGIKIKLPFTPLKNQNCMMDAILKTVKRDKGLLCNTVIMDYGPGTGKTTAILCSVLAWIKGQKVCAYCSSVTATASFDGVIPPLPKLPRVLTEKFPPSAKLLYLVRTIQQTQEVVAELEKTSYRSARKVVLTSDTVAPGYLGTSYRHVQANLVSPIPQSDLKKDIQEAELVIGTYDFLLSPTLRQSIGWNLEEIIVVFDEAHNVANCSRPHLSTRLKYEDILKYHEQLEDLINTEETSPAYLGQTVNNKLLFLAKNLKSIHDRLIDEANKNRDKPRKPHKYKSWIEPVGYDSKFDLDLQEIFYQLYISKETIQDHLRCLDSLPAETLATVDNFWELKQLLHLFQRLIPHRPRGEKPFSFTVSGTENRLWIECLDPSLIFMEIQDSARAVILASGGINWHLAQNIQIELFNTNKPVRNLKSWISPPLRRGYGDGRTRSVPVDKLFIVPFSKLSHTSTPINLYGRMPPGRNGQHDDLAAIITEACKIIPNGVIVHFESQQKLLSVIDIWKKAEVFASVGSGKTIYIEENVCRVNDEDVANMDQTDNQTQSQMHAQVVSDYKRDAVTSKGAVLFAYARGTAIEGINYIGSECRAVITIGLPYFDCFDEEVDLKCEFEIANNGNGSGDEWSQSTAFAAQNTALGRCFRSDQDWGIALMIGGPSYVWHPGTIYFSQWVVDNWEREKLCVPPTHWGEIKSQVSAFVEQAVKGAAVPTPI